MPAATASTDPRREALLRMRTWRIEAARRDCAAFCEFVLKDEKTGAPLVLSAMHEEWFALAGAHDKVLIWAHIESGKSTLLTVGRVLWLLGRDPSLRLAILSNTHNQSTKLLKVIAGHIE